MNQSRRVVVVANRLPVRLDDDDQWQISPGGLVSALTPILQERDGAWVGWAGVPDSRLEPFSHAGIEQVPVTLSDAEIEDFYFGFCNGTLWPLYHDAVRPPEFHRHWWRPYVEVNRRFADVTVEALRPGDIAWVQDYQLQLVPAMIREKSPDATIGFYLHIPFPPVEVFARMPWRRDILHGLLAADVLAFQTRQSASNFARAARKYAGASGGGWREIRYQGRRVRLENAPIGIDVDSFAKLAHSESTKSGAQALRRRLGNPRKVILGVDRLDYTKGIDIRLRAFQTVLEHGGYEPGEVQFVQVAVPSRESVPLYQDMRDEIERLVGQINGEYARAGTQVVTYLYQTMPLEELVQAYLIADVMMVTPLRDGMNLVAKEYVASRVADTGALMLSEFAGAAEQLRDALIVNPHDIDSMAATLARALELEPEEQQRRMRLLRRTVRRDDVFAWADKCLEALGA